MMNSYPANDLDLYLNSDIRQQKTSAYTLRVTARLSTSTVNDTSYIFETVALKRFQ